MNILAVSPDLGLAGSARTVQLFAIEAKRLGHEVSVLSITGSGPREEDLLVSSIPVFHGFEEAEADGRSPNIVFVHREGQHRRSETRICEYYRRKGAKIVELNSFARPDLSPRDPVDMHVFMSEWCLQQWLGRGRGIVPPRQYTIIPPPVDSSAFKRDPNASRHLRARLGIPEQAIVVGRVGSPHEAKWTLDLAHVFGKALATEGRLFLLLHGPPDPVVTRINALPSGVRGRVAISTAVSNDQTLSGIYSAMDIFLHASRIGESFGRVICEAMLCELPIVTLSTPARDNTQIELVRHQQTGIVAHGRKALVDAILSLAKEPETRLRFGREGRRMAEESFSIDKTVGAMLKLFEAVTSADTRPAGTRQSFRQLLQTAGCPAPRLSGAIAIAANSSPHYLLRQLAYRHD
jgi:glycosyltransferase involved in cell wall biosynthesis